MAIAAPTAIQGTARLGRVTKELVRRLDPGEIAVIDHRNLDRVGAVLNASASTDGTYPNAGPLTLVRAGTLLVDAGQELFGRISDGDRLAIEGGRVMVDGTVVAQGRPLNAEELELRLIEQRAAIDGALSDFAQNTVA